MKHPSTSTPNPARKTRYEPPEAKSVHSLLSEMYGPYSLFPQPHYEEFPLFKVMFVPSDPKGRSNNPRESVANLKATFERLLENEDLRNGEDQPVINDFIKEFENTKVVIKPDQIPIQTHTVSEESLWRAGFTYASPVGVLFGISASRKLTLTRQLRVSGNISEAYQGGPQLQRLIWRYAQPVFLLILEELHDTNDFPSTPLDRGLLGVVTGRMLSTICVSKAVEAIESANAGDETRTFLGQMGGKKKKSDHEDYHDNYGLSGLHFIVFPIECIEENKWRIYRGISVCDRSINEDDESFTQDTRNRDNFYRAQKWALGEAELLLDSDSTTVPRSQAVPNRSLSPSAETPSLFNSVSFDHRETDRQGYLPNVDASRANVPVPWVDVDIRPTLNEFAQKQCRLASYYRCLNHQLWHLNLIRHAVHLLRSALSKWCFESTVRALYDLSGCYRHAVGVSLDFGMAKVLRYWANGFRRNYESRSVWLSHLALEMASYRGRAIERKLVSLVLLSRRTVTSLAISLEDTQQKKNVSVVHFSSRALTSHASRLEDSRPGDSNIAKAPQDDAAKMQDVSRPTRLQFVAIGHEEKLRKVTYSVPAQTAKQANRSPRSSLRETGPRGHLRHFLQSTPASLVELDLEFLEKPRFHGEVYNVGIAHTYTDTDLCRCKCASLDSGDISVLKWGHMWHHCTHGDHIFTPVRIIVKAAKVVHEFLKVTDTRGWRIRLNYPLLIECVTDGKYYGKKALVEPYIKKFTKFNSNSGWEIASRRTYVKILQALSHFSYAYSRGSFLLCDLQGGVDEEEKVVILSDPAIVTKKGAVFGCSDIGPKGIRKWFRAHSCNKYCEDLLTPS